ncbi:MAG: serine hydrolase domain-containing protein [Croceibacterium sp.]
MIESNLSRRALLRGSAMLGAGAALAATPFAPALAQGVPGGWYTVDGLLRDYVSARKVAGMVAALGWRQEAPAFVAHGLDSLTGTRASAPDSLYRVYSMTKPITGMAAMMLVDEGKIGLDQPISDFLPAFAKMQVQKVADGAITADNLEPAVRPITLRHLVTHTAGLGYGIVQQGPLRDAMMERGLMPSQTTRLPIPIIERGKTIGGLDHWADQIATLPLVYQPGTKWCYSVGLDLTGRLIEVVSGQSFDSFLQQRIFDPCGMNSSFFRVPDSEKHRLTTNYLVADGLLVPVDPGESSIFLDQPAFPMGGSGLVSCPQDYDRFLQMLAGGGVIDGKRVMSEAAVRLGSSNLFPDTMPTRNAFSYMDLDLGYGAGGLVGTGAFEGIFGWFGAAGTGGLVDLKNSLRFSLFTQYMPSMTYPLDKEFVTAVLRDRAAQLAA